MTTDLKADDHRKALTFVELFIIIIIISILIGVSIPLYRPAFKQLNLNSFSQELLAYMNYLHQRSIIEGKIILLSLDNEKKQYVAKVKNAQIQLKSHAIPSDITIEVDKINAEDKQIFFYPDGQIDPVDVIINLDNENITLTTKGLFGKVKKKSNE
jgi:Tfp pilus assembly protein PilE